METVPGWDPKLVAHYYKLLPHVCAMALPGSCQRLLAPIPGVEQYNITTAGSVMSAFSCTYHAGGTGSLNTKEWFDYSSD